MTAKQRGLAAGAPTLAVLLISVGCGGGGSYDTVPTKGTIKYDDGSVIGATRIELLFVSQQPPIDAKTHPRQGVAEVNVADGAFRATTYEFHDGLIRGKHKVIARSSIPGKGYTNEIPPIYSTAESTPLEVDANGQDLELVIAKPK